MKQIIAYVRQHTAAFGLLVALSAAGAVFESAALVTLVPLTTTVTSRRHEYTGKFLGLRVHLSLAALFGIAVGLVLARTLVMMLTGYVRARIVAGYEEREKTRLVEAYVDLTWEKQAAQGAAQLQDLVTTFALNAMVAVQLLCTSLVTAFSLAILMVAALLVNAFAAILILATITLVFLAVRPISRSSQRLSTEQGVLSQSFAQAVNEAVSLSMEIRIFRASESVKAKVGDIVHRSERIRTVQQTMVSTGAALYQNSALLLVIGGLFVVHTLAIVEIASLASIVLLLMRALSYSQTFQQVYHQFLELSPYGELLESRIAEFDSAKEKLGGCEIGDLEKVEFSHVGYSYVEGSPVVRDVNFTARRGEIIGIVGPSGAGKSTLVQLLLGLRSPKSGEILVNGLPVSEVSRPSWFSRTAFVPQEGLLLNASVTDNIAFFRRDLSEDEIVGAARLAYVHEEVTRWAEGYETSVGERGSAVSGGQRQRLCIARALVGSPELLVLDEPTSALDGESEQLIRRTLSEYGRNALVFIVAHRLSTLTICDRIMVFDRGRLLACAPQSELALTSEYFREVVKLAALA